MSPRRPDAAPAVEPIEVSAELLIIDDLALHRLEATETNDSTS